MAAKSVVKVKGRVSSKLSKLNRPEERRRHKRRMILDTFHVYLSIPKVGPQKFYLRDIGEGGMAIITESLTGIRKGSSLDCLFFINPGLSLSLRIHVVHTMKIDHEQFLLGVTLSGTDKLSQAVYLAFIKLLDLFAKIPS